MGKASPMEQPWQQVSRRKGRPGVFKSQARFIPSASHDDEEVVEPVPNVSLAKELQLIQRVQTIANVLRDSGLLHDALREIGGHFMAANSSLGQATRRHDATKDSLTIVGYGLGSFCTSSNAVHQLGFLVALLRALDETYCLLAVAKASERCMIFDPAMNESDVVIAEQFKLHVIHKNEHARRRVVCNTVFFMPHCAKALYQNVLACNWGPAIKKLVIIGNSFSAYGDRIVAAQERKELLLVRVLPYLEEVRLPCGVPKSHKDFARYEAAFNDLSVHSFPCELLDHALNTDTDLSARMAAVTSLIS